MSWNNEKNTYKLRKTPTTIKEKDIQCFKREESKVVKYRIKFRLGWWPSSINLCYEKINFYLNYILLYIYFFRDLHKKKNSLRRVISWRRRRGSGRWGRLDKSKELFLLGWSTCNGPALGNSSAIDHYQISLFWVFITMKKIKLNYTL